MFINHKSNQLVHSTLLIKATRTPTSESKFLALGIFFILSGCASMLYFTAFFGLIFSLLGLIPIALGVYFCIPEDKKHGENTRQFWDCPNCHLQNIKMSTKRCPKCDNYVTEERQKALAHYGLNKSDSSNSTNPAED